MQRDLLPLVEGTTVSTKYGMIKTDHILFIASGAFHLRKPSDLIPELQGRFPIRVELDSLSVDDFEQILTAPTPASRASTRRCSPPSSVELDFQPDGIRRLAEIAWRSTKDREHRRAAPVHGDGEAARGGSFNAAKLDGRTITIDAAYVDERLAGIVKDDNLAQYIL